MKECDGRIKALRSFFECQEDKTDKTIVILQEMIEHSEKTAVFENKRNNLSPVFCATYTQKMAEAKAKATQEFEDSIVAEIKQNV